MWQFGVFGVQKRCDSVYYSAWSVVVCLVLRVMPDCACSFLRVTWFALPIIEPSIIVKTPKTAKAHPTVNHVGALALSVGLAHVTHIQRLR